MSDNALQVQITADIAQFVTALNQATAKIGEASTKISEHNAKVGDSGRKASEGQKSLADSISGSIREYAAGAAAGFTMASAIEKVGEYSREAVRWVYESAAAVNELADRFNDLKTTTGESLDSLNEVYAGVTQAGEGTALVESLMTGWTRSIKSNSDTLIANGVAADQASLNAMSFKDYLLRVYEISTEMKTPAEANVFLTEALGKSGALAAPKLKDLTENLRENNSALATGNLITRERLEMQDRDEKATGNVKLAYEKAYAAIGESLNRVLVPLKEVAGWTLKTKVAQDDVKKALEAGIITSDHWYDSLEKLAGRLSETLERFRAVAAEATKTAQNSMDVGAGDAARRNRTLQEAPDKPKTPRGAATTPYVDNEALSYNEMVQWMEDYLRKRDEMHERDAQAAARAAAQIAQEKSAYLNQQSEMVAKSQAEMSRWEQAAVQGANHVGNAFLRSGQAVLGNQMDLAQGLRAVWKSIVQTIVQSLAQVLQAHVKTAIMERVLQKGKQQENMATTGTNVVAASSEFFKAHAWIPWVGAAIAIGMIALMSAQMKKTKAENNVVANAQGSLVTGPTLAMIGEGGQNEVVAPEMVFKDWAGNLTANILANQQRVQAYQLQGAALAATASGIPSVPPVTFPNAVIMGESAETDRLIGDRIHKLLRRRDMGTS